MIFQSKFCMKLNSFLLELNLELNKGIISASQFPASFKFANVAPASKDASRNLKDKYRPISILHVVSKDFERLMSKQLPNDFGKIFSRFQGDFKKTLVHSIAFF